MAEWKTSFKDPDNIMVLSEPLCLNESGSVIVRTCFEDKWLPVDPPICYSLLSNNEDEQIICPKHFLSNGDHCIYISPPGTWEEDCVTMPATKSDTAYISTEFPVWLPVKRSAKLGPWEYMTPEEDYGDTFERFMNYPNYKNKCVICKNKNKPELVECSDHYSHVCMVPRYYKWYDCMKKCKHKTRCKCMRYIDEEDLEDYDYSSRQCRNVRSVKYADSDEDDDVENDTCIRSTKYRASNDMSQCSSCIFEYTNIEMVLTFIEDRKKLYLTLYNMPLGK